MAPPTRMWLNSDSMDGELRSRILLLSFRQEKPMDIEQDPTEMSSDSPSETAPPQEPEEELNADKIKEKGNAAFKAGRYHDAIEFYSKAIGGLIITLWGHDAQSRRSVWYRFATFRTHVLDKPRCGVYEPQAVQTRAR